VSYYFQVCSTEVYQERYILFLLQHYEDLQSPYPFPISLSYLASPILMRNEAIICFDEDHNVIGALGYIHGTGEHNYEDTHVIQIQSLYLLEPYRRSRLFLEGLRFLIQHLEQLYKPAPVSEIRFWAPSSPYLRRLLSKLATRTFPSHSEAGTIDEYYSTLAEWQLYSNRFRQL